MLPCVETQENRASSHDFERLLLYQVKERIRILYRKSPGNAEYGFYLSGYVEEDGVKRGFSAESRSRKPETAWNRKASTPETVESVAHDSLRLSFDVQTADDTIKREKFRILIIFPKLQ